MAEMSTQARAAPRPSPARWVVVVLLAAIATCLLIEVGLVTSPAPAQQSSGGGRGGVFAVAGQVTRDTYGLYLVDTQNGTMALYEYVPQAPTGKLRLRSARYFEYDLRLDAYNTEPPPQEIKKLVEPPTRRLKEVPPESP